MDDEQDRGERRHDNGGANGVAPQAAPERQRLPEAAEAIAAIDLGTNNCRLLVAEAHLGGFRVVDSFARIVRLGEGLAQSGRLSDAAMTRAVGALKVCADKMARWSVGRSRVVATEACRSASNGAEFAERVQAETGLVLEIITPAEEAHLAVTGCAELMAPQAEGALVFDIGGGSTELIWVTRSPGEAPAVAAWTSVPLGVVNLAERFDGVAPDDTTYAAMMGAVREGLAAFRGADALRPLFASERVHHLGISGTVTTLASLHLGLRRYQRHRIDGLWLGEADVTRATDAMRSLSFEARAGHACIGSERADLVIPGCAILDAVRELWPSDRLRVADRGLREGLLIGLAGGGRRRSTRRRPSPRKRRARQAAPPVAASADFD